MNTRNWPETYYALKLLYLTQIKNYENKATLKTLNLKIAHLQLKKHLLI